MNEETPQRDRPAAAKRSLDATHRSGPGRGARDGAKHHSPLGSRACRYRSIRRLPEPTRRPSQVDPFHDTIQQLLERYPDITIARVFEELRAQGFTRRPHHRSRAGAGTAAAHRLREPVVRFETSPGVQAQMDYSTYDLDFTAEGRRRVHLFSYVLGYSRRQYLRFVESRTCRPPCANTSAPSNTWAAWPAPACTTT